MRSSFPPVAAIALSIVFAPAHAATHCVDTAGELSQALATAQNDNVDNDIRIAVGTYAAPAGGFRFDPWVAEANRSLKISGGWLAAGNCTTQLFDSTQTTLSGADNRRVLTVVRGNGSGGTFTLSRLTLANGFSAVDTVEATQGLALRLQGGQHTGAATIEHVIVRDNESINGRASVFAAAAGPVTFRNNLVADNAAIVGQMGVTLSVLDEGYVVGNTIVENRPLSNTSDIRGLYVDMGPGAVAYVTNNIIRDNGAPNEDYIDVPATSSMLMIANAIGRQNGPGAPGSMAPITAAPQFIGNGDYRLATSSPLHDMGVDAPIGGQAIADLDGHARKIGAGTDLGAYESEHLPDAIFKHGFD